MSGKGRGPKVRELRPKYIRCEPMNAVISTRQCRNNQRAAERAMHQELKGVNYQEMVQGEQLYFHCGHCPKSRIKFKPSARLLKMMAEIPADIELPSVEAM